MTQDRGEAAKNLSATAICWARAGFSAGNMILRIGSGNRWRRSFGAGVRRATL